MAEANPLDDGIGRYRDANRRDQEAAKHFEAEGGSVINIGSVASSSAPAMSVVYAATNSGVDASTRVLAKELGSRKIRDQFD